jgi:hypothetical protein
MGGFNVGPAVADENLGTVTVNITTADLTITGTVVDCNDNPVDSGFVSMSIDGLNYRAALDSGSFTLPIMRCFLSHAPVQLQVTDLANAQQSAVSSFSADTGTVNVGQISICTVVDTSQYVDFTTAGTSYSIPVPPSTNTMIYNYDSYNSTSTITAYSPNYTTYALLEIAQLTGTGTYTDSAYLMANYGVLTYTVTAFGPVDSYIEGTFTGTLVNNFNAPVPTTGSFRVKRSN